MKPRDSIAIIEAAYRLESPTWQEELLAAASAAVGSKQGAMAVHYDATSGDWIHVTGLARHALPEEFVEKFFHQPAPSREMIINAAKIYASVRFATFRACVAAAGLAAIWDGLLSEYGIDDLTMVNAIDLMAVGCMIFIADRFRRHSPRSAHLWHRLAAHIAAGNRLRRTLGALVEKDSDPVDQAEAVLSPKGRVEHAIGPAERRSSRETLRDALVRIDAARSEREDAGRSVDLWQGLVAGRWSIVEHFERDGKRYYLAYKNDPELARDRVLTPRERQVLGYAELGHSNKLIAYSLGLSLSAVSTLLSRARRKAGGALELLRPR